MKNFRPMKRKTFKLTSAAALLALAASFAHAQSGATRPRLCLKRFEL